MAGGDRSGFLVESRRPAAVDAEVMRSGHHPMKHVCRVLAGPPHDRINDVERCSHRDPWPELVVEGDQILQFPWSARVDRVARERQQSALMLGEV
ncbi:MAG TPA: hypothetical protein VHH15_06075 [Actinophytocola sp.]|nr:hypothetical protein [Actinophytocola sp.]